MNVTSFVLKIVWNTPSLTEEFQSGQKIRAPKLVSHTYYQYCCIAHLGQMICMIDSHFRTWIFQGRDIPDLV